MAKYKVIKLEQTCGACPSQWEGITDDSRSLYIRYRWGYLSVSIGEPEDFSEYAGVRGSEIFGGAIGDEYGGVLSEEKMMAITSEVLNWKEF